MEQPADLLFLRANNPFAVPHKLPLYGGDASRQ